MNVRAIRLAAMLLSAALLPGLAAADDATHTAAGSHTAATVPTSLGYESGTLGFELLPARFRHGPSTAAGGPIGRSDLRAVRPDRLATLDYRDRSALITRLAELDASSLLTFIETRAFSVFLGLSSEGIPVLNIISRKSERAGDTDDEPIPPADPAHTTILAAAGFRH